MPRATPYYTACCPLQGMLPIEVKRDYLAHFEARVFGIRCVMCMKTWSIRLYWIRWETALRGSFLRTDQLGYGFSQSASGSQGRDLYLFYQAFPDGKRGMDFTFACRIRRTAGEWSLKGEALSGTAPERAADRMRTRSRRAGEK